MSPKALSLLLIILLTYISCPANESKSKALVDEAWKAWQKNDHELVQQKFSEAVKEDDKNVRAYLGLTLLYSLENRFQDAWNSFRKVIELDKNYYPYAYSLITSNMMANKELTNPEIPELYKKLIEKSDSDGILRAMAHERLGKYYQTKNDFAQASAQFAGMDALKDWMLIGPFENISAQGYDKVYPPETEFISDKTYEGKSGVPAKWTLLKKNRSDCWTDFTRYYAHTSAVFYGNTFIYSPVKQTVQIRVGTSGSLRTFLNDQMIMDVFDENNNDLDTYITETVLQEGWNRLLIKCGSSEIASCNFLVRITDKNGGRIENLKYSASEKNYTRNCSEQTKSIENFAEKFFREKISSNPQEPENYIFLAEAYLRNDKAIEAELILNDAIKMMPDCMLFYHRIAEAYLRGKKQAEMETAYEKMFNADKNIPDVLQYKIMNFLKNEEYEKAAEVIKLLEKAAPESELLTGVYLELYGKKKEIEKILETNRKACQLFPYNAEFAYLEAVIAFQKSKDYKEAVASLEDFLKRNYSDNVLYWISQFCLQGSDVPKWEEYMYKLIEMEPASPGFYYNMADVYFTMRKYDKAEDNLKKAIELCGNSAQYWNKLGDTYRMENENDKAAEAYNESLQFNPANYEARDVLRELRGQQSLFQLFESEDIARLMKDSPSREKFPADNGVILLNDMKRIVYKKGASESTQELLVKLFNKKGIDDFKEYWITHNSNSEQLIVEKAVVIKKDGSEIKADVDDNHIVFKSLEENDFIYIKNRIKNQYAGKLSNFYWDSFNFNGFYPAQKLSYSVLLEDNTNLKYKTQNMPETPEIKEVKEGTIYRWVLRDEPAVKEEYGMPALNDVGKMLHISNIPDWSYLVEWYSDLAKNKARASYEIKELVEKLLKGKENLTVDQKIAIIYNFITENISYSSVSFRQSGLVPQKARDVLITKIGDCKDVATLCKAMLNEAGIKSYYVLVNTIDNGRNFCSLPSLCFNHCIIAVETPKGERFLDLTAENYPVNSLPSMDIDAFYLMIKPGVTAPGRIPKNSTQPSNLSRYSEAVISSTGDLNVTTRSVKTGILSASTRGVFRFKDSLEVKKSLSESLNSIFPNAKLTGYEYKNLDEVESPLEYWFRLEIPNYVTETGSFTLIKIPWEDRLETNYGLSYEKRSFPYYLPAFADTMSEEFVLRLPEGFEPMEKDLSASYTSAFADYSLSCRYENGNLYAKRNILYKKTEITIDEYTKCKDFYNKVIKEDSRQILLKRKS
ncbi:MAG: tetratricopeptide repeat protein [Ignavibacteriales bacterium]